MIGDLLNNDKERKKVFDAYWGDDEGDPDEAYRKMTAYDAFCYGLKMAHGGGIDRIKVFGHCQQLWAYSRQAEEAIILLRKRLGDLQQATFTEHSTPEAQ